MYMKTEKKKSHSMPQNDSKDANIIVNSWGGKKQ